MYTDSHCHIFSKNLLLTIDDILNNCIKTNTLHLVNVECERNSIQKSLELSQSLPHYQLLNIKHSIGVHPDHFHDPDIVAFHDEIHEIISELQETHTNYSDIIVAIGECGLDYYRSFHKEAQKELFIAQILLAQKLHLPVVIHIREAWGDFFEIFSEFPNVPGVMHCFTGNTEIAEWIVKNTSLHISFSGIVTFKNAKDIQEAVLSVPHSRLLIETDSPYLAPEPHRGKTNEPSYVQFVAKKIAELLGKDQEYIGKVTTENAKKLFGFV